MVRKNNNYNEKSRKTLDTFNKLDVISEIRDLQAKALNYKIKGDYNNAIILSDQILRLSIKHNLSSILQEQKDFITEISQIVEKEYFIPKIVNFANWILDQYIKLAESNGIYQAHNLVRGLIEMYGDLEFFHTIPEVNELLKKDEKEWMRFTVNRESSH